MSKDEIKLHPEKGLNPHMTFCSHCGEESEELVLLGAEDKKYTCPKCDALHFGRPDPKSDMQNLRACQKCGHPFDSQWANAVIEEWEKLPSTEPCKKCQERLNVAGEAVKEGGIFWKCDDCGSHGAIHKDAPIAKLVREKMGIEPPDPVGVTFGKDHDCPVCSENAVVSEDES